MKNIDIMEKYAKVIDGNLVVKDRKTIVVIKGGMQIINASHDILMEDGWTPYSGKLSNELPRKELLERIKNEKISEILEYDSSYEVNSFYMGNTMMWLDKATRVGLMLRFEAEEGAGKEETTLWYNGASFTLELKKAKAMLQAIELYASACYDNTQLHLSKVESLDTVSDIKAYEYTTGYPVPLRF